MLTEDHIPLTADVMQLVTPEQAWHYKIIPKAGYDDTLVFFAEEQSGGESLREELELLFGKKIQLEITATDRIHKTLNKYYRLTRHESKTIALHLHKADDFLSRLILEARQLGSSDIHIEIYDEKARVRIRIDGMLIERYVLQKQDYPALVNKTKIKANLDISEKRLPQDGRIQFHEAGHKIDIRVSVLPTLHGEKIVLRLLSNDATRVHIEKLGFSEQELHSYLEGIKKPHGILLISGPTGSGKTTTLYATLKILNEEKRNIVTIEDPIEYTLEGINQVQLKESIGLSFASALRTFLRQDPDVIMLGEIRDGETAQMAIRAALTGHLVLSTIHTNSAWGTVSRLIDMGVPPFLLAGTLNTSVAQRLLRMLCPECKREEKFDPAHFPAHFKAPEPVSRHWVAQGCAHCHYTGYKGRRAVYEIIPIDYEISEYIRNSRFSIAEELKARQIHSLSENAFELFKNGLTSIEETYPLLVNNH